MHGEEIQRTMDANQSGLSQAEVAELQARLDTEGWAALLAVQHALANAPLLAPSADFGERVMQAFAVRERRQAQRRSGAGVLAFVFGSTIFTALLIWLSPISALAEANVWADLLNTLASLMAVLTVVLEIAGAFAQVLQQLFGEEMVVALSLFALSMTILWTRIVVGWTPLNRPEPV